MIVTQFASSLDCYIGMVKEKLLLPHEGCHLCGSGVGSASLLPIPDPCRRGFFFPHPHSPHPCKSQQGSLENGKKSEKKKEK